MAERPPLSEAWITDDVITMMADEMPFAKREHIQLALRHLTNEVFHGHEPGPAALGALRFDRKNSLALKVRPVVDLANDETAMEWLRTRATQVTPKDAELISNFGWVLTRIFNPPSRDEMITVVDEARRSMGFDRSLPRDQIWFGAYLTGRMLEEIGFEVSTFLQNKLAIVTTFAGYTQHDAPNAIANLRLKKVVTDYCLNVQDLVVLGEDEAALEWLHQHVSPRFGPQAVLLFQNLAEALRHCFPVEPTEAIKE